jgi:hypothetical protein
MEKLEEIEEQSKGDVARIINKATATELIRDKAGAIVGVHYTQGGKKFTEYGPGAPAAPRRHPSARTRSTQPRVCRGSNCSAMMRAHACGLARPRPQSSSPPAASQPTLRQTAS